jgi:hypothetical protein
LNNGAGGGYFSGYSSEFIIGHNNEYIAGSGWVARSTTASQIGQASGEIQFFSNSGLTAGNAFTPSERMRITSGGNLGLGATSPSNTAGFSRQLQISGTTAALTLTSSTGGSNYSLGAGSVGDFGLWNNTTSSYRWYVDSSGNIGIGSSSPSTYGNVVLIRSQNSDTRMWIRNEDAGSSSRCSYVLNASGNSWSMGMGSTANNSNALTWLTDVGGGNNERMRLTTGGNLGIGTTNPLQPFVVSNGGAQGFEFVPASGIMQVYNRSTSAYGDMRFDAAQIIFFAGSSLAERARIDSSGNFLVGTTNTDPVVGNVVGGGISAAGIIRGSATSSPSLGLNRRVDDGDLVHFYQAGAFEGSISVSGATVSYNAFAGSHWSQLQDGSKPNILRGTVMESINELCVWSNEQNERLPKSKISDTAGSKKVYGVFMAWDNDWTETNDMYVTAVGAFICRVNGSVTVQEGDLLESNGDGTARVQADDIIRSSTIGKVTSTIKTHQYDDGSYCVPTVLYCG